jgi:hypothetical protein
MRTALTSIVLASMLAAVGVAQADQLPPDPRQGTAHDQAVETLLDAANGQSTCDLRSIQAQPHCVPAAVRRILAGGNWRLIENLTPAGIGVACLGGASEACHLSQLAEDAAAKDAIAQECTRKNPARRLAAKCKAVQKEAWKAEAASVEANNAAIIRPEGCCGTATEAYSPNSGSLAQFLMAFANQLNQMRNTCETSASARFHSGTAPWHQAYVYCLTH